MMLVFLLEEPSMAAFLQGLLPRILPGQVEVISGARALGPVIDLENRRSASFAHLINGVRRLVQEA